MIAELQLLFQFLAAPPFPFPGILPRRLDLFSALVLLAISLALIFAGKQIIRVIAFIAIGLAVGAAFAAGGTLILGVVGFVIGGILGFIIGGLLSLVLLPLAIGIGIGLVAYDIMQAILHVYIFSLIVGVIFFVIGIIISLKLLALATAFFGALLLFDALLFFGVPGILALLLCIILGVIGFWVQGGFKSRQGSKFVTWSNTPPPAGAVRVNPQTQSNVVYCPHCGTRIENPGATKYCPNCGGPL